MAQTTANTLPVFPAKPNNQWITVGLSGSANTNYDGTGTLGTNIFTAFTSSNTDGSLIRQLRVQPLGTNGSASVLRVFLNNGSTNGTATNNSLIAERQLAVTSSSQTAPLQPVNVPIGIAIPNGHRILVSVGTVGTAGWQVTVEASDL